MALPAGSLRVLFWAPFVLLVLGVAVVVGRAGYVWANLTESDVIEKYAARYVASSPFEGAVRTDCVARPGVDRGVWISVACAPGGDATRGVVYHVSRFGGLVSGGWSAQTEGIDRFEEFES